MAVDAAVETPVASSATGSQQPESGGDVLSQMTGEELSSWKSSGKVPERLSAPPKEKEPEGDEKPASSAGAAPAKTAALADKKEPASATGKAGDGDGKPDNEAQARIKDLLARVSTLETENASLKKPPAAAAPKAEVKTEPAAPAEAKEPKLDDYGDDVEKYIADKVAWEISQKLTAADKQRSEADNKAKATKTLEEGITKWKERCVDARKKHADYDSVALAPDVPVPAGSVIDRWLFRSPQGAEMLYHLAQNREELAAINSADEYTAAGMLRDLEVKLGVAPAAEGDKGKAEPKPAPKKVSDAPPPPTEVRAQATPSDDPIADAINKGDAGAYIRNMNKRENVIRR
jgi:hypothetical protein